MFIVMRVSVNPFRYGDLALGDAFADREQEVAELTSDALNGQNVVIIAPRRFGKTSLIRRVAHDLVRRQALATHINLMTAPTKEQLVEQLMRGIYADIARPLDRARDSAVRFVRGLRITPRITLDPDDGSVGFSLDTGHPPEDVDATLMRLLELPAELAAARDRRVVVIFDEFQEITLIDPRLPALMRTVFQEQPEVSHIYLGSKRHMMQKIFNDQNEPFWRSSKQLELGPIPADRFVEFVERRFRASGRSVERAVARRLVEVTGGHPYATQELAYALWEQAGTDRPAAEQELERAMDAVLRSENAHFALVWEDAGRNERLLLQALAAEPNAQILAEDYRRRHKLGAASTIQYTAAKLAGAELIGRSPAGRYRIVEPFLREWLRRNAR